MFPSPAYVYLLYGSITNTKGFANSGVFKIGGLKQMNNLQSSFIREFGSPVSRAAIIASLLLAPMQIVFSTHPFEIVGTVIGAVIIFMVYVILSIGGIAVKSTAYEPVNTFSGLTELQIDGHIPVYAQRLRTGLTRTVWVTVDAFNASQIRHRIARIVGANFPNFSFQFLFGKISSSHSASLHSRFNLWLGLIGYSRNLSACFYFITPQSVIQPNFQGLNPCIETPY